MRYISIDSAQPGMIVGKSIYNEQGSILVNYRVKLTERLISRMRDIGLAGLYIEDELSSDITVEDLISDELGVKATKALTKLDIDAALKVASDITEELSLNGDINVNLISMRTKLRLYLQTFGKCSSFVGAHRYRYRIKKVDSEGTFGSRAFA